MFFQLELSFTIFYLAIQFSVEKDITRFLLKTEVVHIPSKGPSTRKFHQLFSIFWKKCWIKTHKPEFQPVKL